MSANSDLQDEISNLRSSAAELMAQAEAEFADAIANQDPMDTIALYIEDGEKYQAAQKLYGEADLLEAKLSDPTVLDPVTAEDNWQHVENAGSWETEGDWSPDAANVAEGQEFTQTRSIFREITDYWENTATGEIRDDNSGTEQDTESQSAIGTMAPENPPPAPPPPPPTEEIFVPVNVTSPVSHTGDAIILLPPVQAEDNWQHVYQEGDWSAFGDWAPDPADIEEGEPFTQTRDTEREITDYWQNPATGETREDQSRTETGQISRMAIGTMAPPIAPPRPPPHVVPPVILPPVKAEDNWQHVYEEGDWLAVSEWFPDPSTVPQSQAFTQSRDMERNVTDFWRNSATKETREDNSHAETKEETRNAVGTMAPPADAEPPPVILPPVKAVDNWEHVYAEGDWSAVGDWLPSGADIPQGTLFTQSRTLARLITDFWRNSDTGEIRDNLSHTEFSSESRPGEGELVVLDPFRAADDWEHVYDEGQWAPVGDWVPLPESIPAGVPFTQSRAVARIINDYWQNTATLEIRDNRTRTEVSSESRDAIGTYVAPRPVAPPPWNPPPPIFKEPTRIPDPKHVYNEGEWQPVGDWAPDPGTIAKNLPFAQSRDRRRVITDYMETAAGSRYDDFTHVEEGREQRNAVGTKIISGVPGGSEVNNSAASKNGGSWLWLLLAALAVAESQNKKRS